MKLFNLFFILLVSLTFASCDDEEDPVSSDDGIVGTWDLQTFEFDVESSTTSPLFNSESVTSGTATASDYQVTFTDNGTWTATGSYSVTITSTVDGVRQASTPNDYTSVNNTGTYTVDGNLISVDGSFFTLEFQGMQISGVGGPQVVPFEINGNTLKFTQDDESEITSGEVTTETRSFSESIWERQ
ncbi:hypothetical protein [Lewinella sp. 4G2]|uniref:hypothetical protein n=1 Tax=Lewinella sp. 4G2 TaxID=1803372 RepID=UPI0007B4A236|nr:hypothetical protein [Lewinella sp. 4G2]OAV43810.1 hypothetical protein A3850_004540 [Lewinella sp. 4G2]